MIIGAVNSANTAGYYAVDKATRDASLELAQVRAGIESTIVWLPYFKFLGVAMILGGITMALGVIGLRLQNLGKEVMASLPDQARLPIPPKPVTAYLMRMFMMVGMLIIIIGFIVSLNVAGTASAVFSNPITAIDAAATGSPLLANLANIHAAEAWLEAFKFVGVAFPLLGDCQWLGDRLSSLYAISKRRFLKWRRSCPSSATDGQNSTPVVAPAQ